VPSDILGSSHIGWRLRSRFGSTEKSPLAKNTIAGWQVLLLPLSTFAGNFGNNLTALRNSLVVLLAMHSENRRRCIAAAKPEDESDAASKLIYGGSNHGLSGPSSIRRERHRSDL
jgi:hypothetical protein